MTITALAFAALLAFAPSAMAQDTEPTVALDKEGSTTLSLSKKAKQVLNRAGVTVTGRKHAIIAGAIDPSDFQPAEIDHKGRIVFKAGRDKVIFKKLTLLRGPQNRLTGQTGGETVTIARVTGGTVVRQGLESTDLNGAKGRLTRTAARLLNRGLETGRFKRGLLLGRLSTDTHYSEVLVAESGETALQVDPAAIQKMTSANISPTAVPPATMTLASNGLPVFHFPISGGRLDPATGFGTVEHAGGLQLSQQGGNTIVLDTPFVEIAATSRLVVSLGGVRTSPADVDMSGATKTPRTNGVDIAGAVVKLNAAGAAALNTLFNTTVFAAGDVVGTTTSNITFK